MLQALSCAICWPIQASSRKKTGWCRTALLANGAVAYHLTSPLYVLSRSLALEHTWRTVLLMRSPGTHPPLSLGKSPIPSLVMATKVLTIEASPMSCCKPRHTPWVALPCTLLHTCMCYLDELSQADLLCSCRARLQSEFVCLPQDVLRTPSKALAKDLG